jgi:tRNA U54 and U55 pseudouridine synthase Pus10
MKVKDLIQMLTTDFTPDEELMVMWWDSAFREHTAGTWDMAVKIFDEVGVSTFSIDEQITDLLTECEEEIKAELAVDSYLEQEDERELING